MKTPLRLVWFVPLVLYALVVVVMGALDNDKVHHFYPGMVLLGVTLLAVSYGGRGEADDGTVRAVDLMAVPTALGMMVLLLAVPTGWGASWWGSAIVALVELVAAVWGLCAVAAWARHWRDTIEALRDTTERLRVLLELVPRPTAADLEARREALGTPDVVDIHSFLNAYWGGVALLEWVVQRDWGDEALQTVPQHPSELALLTTLLQFMAAKGHLPELRAQSAERCPEVSTRVRWPDLDDPTEPS